jgi:hypothetical protein
VNGTSGAGWGRAGTVVVVVGGMVVGGGAPLVRGVPGPAEDVPPPQAAAVRSRPTTGTDAHTDVHGDRDRLTEAHATNGTGTDRVHPPNRYRVPRPPGRPFPEW